MAVTCAWTTSRPDAPSTWREKRSFLAYQPDVLTPFGLEWPLVGRPRVRVELWWAPGFAREASWATAEESKGAAYLELDAREASPAPRPGAVRGGDVRTIRRQRVHRRSFRGRRPRSSPRSSIGRPIVFPGRRLRSRRALHLPRRRSARGRLARQRRGRDRLGGSGRRDRRRGAPAANRRQARASLSATAEQRAARSRRRQHRLGQARRRRRDRRAAQALGRGR